MSESGARAVLPLRADQDLPRPPRQGPSLVDLFFSTRSHKGVVFSP